MIPNSLYFSKNELASSRENPKESCDKSLEPKLMNAAPSSTKLPETMHARGVSHIIPIGISRLSGPSTSARLTSEARALNTSWMV